jgi:hypothetical protein
MDGAFEFGQVVVDGGLQDQVVSVEVAMRQVIAHACDLAPGDAGLGAEHHGRSQRYEVTFGAGADGGFEIAGWYQVDLDAEDGLQVGLDTP